MKRKYYKDNGRRQEEETSYWMSYSDMMAAILLVFVLIISFSVLLYKKDMDKTKAELLHTNEELAGLLEDFNKQEGIIIEQREKLKVQEQEMADKQKELDDLIGIRTDIIEALTNKFKNSKYKISVDPQDGAIIFDSNLLFDFKKHNIKADGKNFLDEFLPQYFSVIFQNEFKDYIAEIIIEGHTDPEGSYLYNLELSQERALEVAKYCLSYKKKIPGNTIEQLRPLLTANGRSESDLIYDSKGKVDKQASRRVEIKFRLKEDEMIKKMLDILNK